MSETKKLFKHGGSLALVIPKEFIKKTNSNKVHVEIKTDKNGNPTLIISPINDLDLIEKDPLFWKFIDAIYTDAMTNPQNLKESKDVWPENIDQLLEGVDASDDEE